MSFQLPDSIIDALLDKLGNDDTFRAQFATDPRVALAGLGFEPAADPRITRGAWECLTVDELASKEEIRAASEVMRRRFSAKAFVFFPFAIGIRHDDGRAVA